jgi:phospholipase C
MSNGTAAADPIKHVIVLMLENHSFDQMLGCFQGVYPELEGIDSAKPARTNNANGVAVSHRTSLIVFPMLRRSM